MEKLNPEVIEHFVGGIPFFALGLALIFAAIVCVSTVFLSSVELVPGIFSKDSRDRRPSAFQEKDGEARHRKPVIGVLLFSALILGGLGVLSLAGLNGHLTETAELMASIETKPVIE